MDVMTKIRQEYRNFSTTNRRIADYLLKEEEEIFSLTAADIAEKTKTSPATVIRFARLIGFSGLEDLKLSIASHHGAKKTDKIVDPIIDSNDSTAVLTAKVAYLVTSTIGDLVEQLDFSQLEEVASHLREAETIYLLGLGASSLTAYDLYHKLNRAGHKAMYNFDSHMNLEFLNNATKQDVVVAITYSGLTKEVLLGCQVAKKQGVTVVLITSNGSERIQSLADYLLLVPDNEHIVRVGAISSKMSSMVLGDILYLATIQKEIDQVIPRRMVDTNRIIGELKTE